MTNWILGDLFHKRYDHFGSMVKLWEKKWKFPCQKSVYPFHDGAFEDFEPIIQKLIEAGINDAYDDEYTKFFLPTAEALTAKAMAAQASDRAKAINLYKRAACVYRISRFPYISSEIKKQAFNDQIAVYLRGASLWDVPMSQTLIPHVHAAGKDGKEIPVFVRIPRGAREGSPVPVILLITGLDGHLPDNTLRTDEFLARGWATVIADIPGTASCPATRSDPLSPDRLYSSILDWMDSQPQFNMSKCVAWGLSAGGYYAIRLAHTHADRIAGAVGQGAGTHHYLGREWLEHVDDHEYPFSVTKALVMKYDFKDVEDLMENAQRKFSLVDNGILEKKSCRLLLVNGTLDGLMPIEDSMLLMNYGRAKEARFYPGLLHMGYPPANESVYPWMEEVIATAPSRTASTFAATTTTTNTAQSQPQPQPQPLKTSLPTHVNPTGTGLDTPPETPGGLFS